MRPAGGLAPPTLLPARPYIAVPLCRYRRHRSAARQGAGGDSAAPVAAQPAGQELLPSGARGAVLPPAATHPPPRPLQQPTHLQTAAQTRRRRRPAPPLRPPRPAPGRRAPGRQTTAAAARGAPLRPPASPQSPARAPGAAPRRPPPPAAPPAPRSAAAAAAAARRRRGCRRRRRHHRREAQRRGAARRCCRRAPAAGAARLGDGSPAARRPPIALQPRQVKQRGESALTRPASWFEAHPNGRKQSCAARCPALASRPSASHSSFCFPSPSSSSVDCLCRSAAAQQPGSPAYPP